MRECSRMDCFTGVERCHKSMVTFILESGRMTRLLESVLFTMHHKELDIMGSG